jgi:hypothetical protein
MPRNFCHGYYIDPSPNQFRYASVPQGMATELNSSVSAKAPYDLVNGSYTQTVAFLACEQLSLWVWSAHRGKIFPHRHGQVRINWDNPPLVIFSTAYN